MNPFRILFLGTPDIATPCLERLVSSPEFQVVGVITQPDKPAGRHMKLQQSPVKQVALKHGLQVISPESAKDSSVLSWIRDLKPDSAVVVAYGQILSRDFLSLFPKPAVNIHASLLPRWRGAAPIQRAIVAGDHETGVSLQVIVPKLDAGPLLGAREIVLSEDMTAYDLYMGLKTSAPELLGAEYLEYLRGQRKPQEQNEALVTIAQKIGKEEGLIDWNHGADEIRNRIRGFWMWPGCWTTRGGKNLKIWKTSLIKGGPKAPGVIQEVKAGSFVISCGQGALEIFEVQPESRPKMAVAEYLKGYPMKAGEKLG